MENVDGVRDKEEEEDPTHDADDGPNRCTEKIDPEEMNPSSEAGKKVEVGDKEGSHQSHLQSSESPTGSQIDNDVSDDTYPNETSDEGHQEDHRDESPPNARFFEFPSATNKSKPQRLLQNSHRVRSIHSANKHMYTKSKVTSSITNKININAQSSAEDEVKEQIDVTSPQPTEVSTDQKVSSTVTDEQIGNGNNSKHVHFEQRTEGVHTDTQSETDNDKEERVNKLKEQLQSAHLAPKSEYAISKSAISNKTSTSVPVKTDEVKASTIAQSLINNEEKSEFVNSQRSAVELTDEEETLIETEVGKIVKCMVEDIVYLEAEDLDMSPETVPTLNNTPVDPVLEELTRQYHIFLDHMAKLMDLKRSSLVANMKSLREKKSTTYKRDADLFQKLKGYLIEIRNESSEEKSYKDSLSNSLYRRTFNYLFSSWSYKELFAQKNGMTVEKIEEFKEKLMKRLEIETDEEASKQVKVPKPPNFKLNGVAANKNIDNMYTLKNFLKMMEVVVKRKLEGLVGRISSELENKSELEKDCSLLVEIQKVVVFLLDEILTFGGEETCCYMMQRMKTLTLTKALNEALDGTPIEAPQAVEAALDEDQTDEVSEVRFDRLLDELLNEVALFDFQMWTS